MREAGAGQEAAVCHLVGAAHPIRLPLLGEGLKLVMVSGDIIHTGNPINNTGSREYTR